MLFLRLLLVLMAAAFCYASWANYWRWHAFEHGQLVHVRVIDTGSLHSHRRGSNTSIIVEFKGVRKKLLVERSDREHYSDGAEVEARWLRSKDLLVTTNGDHMANWTVTGALALIALFVAFRLPRWLGPS